MSGKNIFFCFLSLILALSSCKKDDDNPPVNTTIIQAGVYDSAFIYHAFSPALKISINWDSLNLYGFGTDSTDLDTDGNFDLVIDLSVLNYDSIHLLQGLPNPFPNCRLVPKNGWEIAIYHETYYIGLGQTAVADFTDTLSYGERIDQIPSWYGETQTGIKMWGENPGGAGTPSCGGWYYAEGIKYIGLKRADGKYGWIEIDSSDPYHPVFLSYAVQE